MNDWINLHTFLAFLLGVLMSAMVKGWTSQIRSKI